MPDETTSVAPDPIDGGDPAAMTSEGAAGEGAIGGGGRRRLAPFIVLAVAAVLAGLFVVLAGADPNRDETAETPLLGRVAPDTVGSFADGSTFDLARRKGSWVVLNFFTSDCIPCQREHPELIEFAQQQASLGDDGAELYTMVFDDTPDRVDQFFAERGGDWPVVYDDDSSISVGFGVSKVPETWVIDPDGVIQARFISEVTADGLSSVIQQLREAT